MTVSPRIDPVGEALTALGVVRGPALLDLDECLMVPQTLKLGYPWNLPSRLFIFPVGVTPYRAREVRQLYLLHPELREHPFVAWIERETGVQVATETPPAVSSAITAADRQWQHATDLVTAGEIFGLHQTRRFTSDSYIFKALVRALVRNGPSRDRPAPMFDVHAARLLLQLSGVAEPSGNCSEMPRHVLAPEPQKIKPFSSHWLVQAAKEAPENVAWTLIHMIESGYAFYNFYGHLEWSESGKEFFGQTVVQLPSIE